MKRTSIVPLFCLALLTLPALAQTPDTTSAWRYLPLEVGNVWEYEVDLKGEVGYERREVTRDTLIEGERFFSYVVQRVNAAGEPVEPADASLLRFDPLSAEVVTPGEEDTSPFFVLSGCPFNAPFGGEVECGFCGFVTVSGGYESVVTVGGDTVTTPSKYFDTQGCEQVFAFAADLGFFLSFTDRFSQTLRYARIDGRAYGEPLPVAAEEAPASSALALSANPNPSRGATTLRVSLGAPQRVRLAVFDVLGRRVHTADLGVRPAGENAHRLDLAALPAGVYVVRLTGDAGVQATTRIVRQK